MRVLETIYLMQKAGVVLVGRFSSRQCSSSTKTNIAKGSKYILILSQQVPTYFRSPNGCL